MPVQANEDPQHEPRAGMLMCKNHHGYFDNYDFFIRYLPEVSLILLCFELSIHWKQIRRFVFVNYSGASDLRKFHGKAVALDINDRHVPFSSLFIIHEMRVRGFHPFEPIEPTMPDEVTWQDWISSEDVFDSASGSFKRDRPPGSPNNKTSSQQQSQCQPTTMSAGGASSSLRPLDADVIADILAVTHAMPSWKACQMEGTSQARTVGENV